MDNEAYIGRQPILDKRQTIVGYELLFRHNSEIGHAEVIGDIQAGTNILANTLGNIGTNWPAGDCLAFINVSNSMLETDLLGLLPANRTVLEILETTQATPDFLAHCQKCRAQGFQIALDNFVLTPESSPLISVANYIKVNARSTDPKNIDAILGRLDQTPDKKLIVEKIETREEFVQYQKLGCHFFQGYYFAHPESLSAKVINPAHANILGLLNKIRNNADMDEIDVFFKRDVALSFRLLRYINSVGFGLSCQIQSIRHALTILGYQQLYRWLTLLLVTANETSTAPALMKTTIIRGRLTELLGHSYLEKQEWDNLFIVGIFSLLDVMLEMPMENILSQLNLPESIDDALLRHEGIYGPFLALAEACEGSDLGHLKKMAESLQLEPEQVNQAHMSALAWVEELGI